MRSFPAGSVEKPRRATRISEIATLLRGTRAAIRFEHSQPEPKDNNMSKQTFATLDLTTLSTVTGGLHVEGKGSVEIGPGTGKVSGEVKYDRSNYESCVAAVTSRPNWTPDQLKGACGLPPQN